MRFTVIMSPEEKGYSVFCPAVRNVGSCGDDWDDALYMIKECVEITLEVDAEDFGRQGWVDETPEVIANGLREVLEIRQEIGQDFTVRLATVEITLPTIVP